MCLGLLLFLAIGTLLVDADEREKRAPILGLLLAKKLLFGEQIIVSENAQIGRKDMCI